jgi:hypothetical protein
MKTYLMTAILALSLLACNETEDLSYRIDPALESYVNTFISEASERGLTVPTNNLIVEISPNSQTIARAIKIDGQNYVYVSPSIMNPSMSMEYSVFNALGSIFAKNQVIVNPSTYDREAFFDDLIN